MSKTLQVFLKVFAASWLILHLFNNSSGQDIEAKITLDAEAPNIAHVEGKFHWDRKRGDGRNFSFLRDYAEVSNLGERVSGVSLKAEDGTPVKFRRLMAGEYVAESDFTGWSYDVDLKPIRTRSAAAHLSWTSDENGIIFVDDILPQTAAGFSTRVIFGSNIWPAFLTVKSDRETNAITDDRQAIAIYLGKNIRDLSVRTKNLRFLISGNWQFSDDDVVAGASEIFDSYQKIFGTVSHAQISIMKFPIPVPMGEWEADTRGSNVTIVSSDMPFKTQSLQRLHEQLRHEMFHLWIPNGVNLDGHYDWFYEGFALYQSLKIGVSVNRITFDDYLDTLSRAYEIDKSTSQRVSLIAASENRWAGSNTQIYARGMLVAFLCDLSLLEASGGKRSAADLLHELYVRHRPPAAPQDGNTAVITLLRSYKELVPVVDHNITGSENIDWSDLLRGAGLEVEIKDQVTKLKVTAKPAGRQKDLLDRLGYNNWRKTS